MWKTTGILLGKLNFRLQLLCASSLYLPEKWQWSLTSLSFTSFCVNFLLQIWRCFLSWCDYSSFSFNGTILFFFQNELHLWHVLLVKCKTFLSNLLCDINCAYLMTLNILKEHAHLFLLLKIFLDYFYRFKICINYIWCFIWLHILIKF